MHVVLYQPEIPPNTGNISRTCVATCSHLHLIPPLGFDISDSQLKRAGLDYWKDLQLTVHASVDDFLVWLEGKAFWLVSTKGQTRYDKFPVEPNTVLIFGRETAGLPSDWIERWYDRTVVIPMWGATRSLNLSNSVSVVLYDAYRRLTDFSNIPK